MENKESFGRDFDKLEDQTQIFLEVLNSFEALSIYYSHLGSKKTIDEISRYLVEFIFGLFDRIKEKVWVGIYLPEDESFEFELKMLYPSGMDKGIFETEFNGLIEDGIVGWTIKHRKKSTFKTREKNLFKNGLLFPLFASDKTLGLVTLFLNCEITSLSRRFLQILELGCLNTSIFMDNLFVNQKLKAYNDHLKHLVDQGSAELEKTKNEMNGKNAALGRFNSFMVARELKMKELKNEIKILKKRLREYNIE